MAEWVSHPAFWGLGGAFIYAGPRLSACVFAARQSGGGWSVCAMECAVALAIGAFAAAAFGPWVLAWRGAPKAHELNAIAAMIGLLANPMAPQLVSGSGRILKTIVTGRLDRLFKGDDA